MNSEVIEALHQLADEAESDFRSLDYKDGYKQGVLDAIHLIETDYSSIYVKALHGAIRLKADQLKRLEDQVIKLRDILQRTFALCKLSPEEEDFLKKFLDGELDYK